MTWILLFIILSYHFLNIDKYIYVIINKIKIWSDYQGCSLSTWTKNGSCGGYANSNLHEPNLVLVRLLTWTKLAVKLLISTKKINVSCRNHAWFMKNSHSYEPNCFVQKIS